MANRTVRDTLLADRYHDQDAGGPDDNRTTLCSGVLGSTHSGMSLWDIAFN